MTIKVIKNAYYVSEDLTGIGMVDQATLEASYSHLLVVGDVWVVSDDEYFECIEGTWKGESNEGWWDYNGYEDYFEIIK